VKRIQSTMVEAKIIVCVFSIPSHMLKGVNPCIRGLGEVVLGKKTRGRKSRDTVPLNTIEIIDKGLLKQEEEIEWADFGAFSIN
jgi:hypothetical protein